LRRSCFGLLLAMTAACASAPPARYAEPPADGAGALALAGDLQRTLWFERLIGREQNDDEREQLVRDLAAQRPGLLVLLGDLTNDGGSRSAWEKFDELAAPLRAAGVPGLMVLGNHDYWGGEAGVIENAAPRFSHLARSRWSWWRWGRLGLLLLDTNQDRLGEERFAAEQAFAKAALDKLDADPAVRGVLVLAHHAPFTNSKTTGDEESLQRAFLPAFFAAKKTLAFISGHAHAYERFEQGGRAFIVSGGGGGPRVQLLTGKDARHSDLFVGPSPRPFHYLLIDQTDTGLRVTVRGFDKGETQARVIETVELPYR
jgi:3',5'-cyclic AMP phosphodiesterase CpdA